jgi:hypothetical protein
VSRAAAAELSEKMLSVEKLAAWNDIGIKVSVKSSNLDNFEGSHKYLNS